MVTTFLAKLLCIFIDVLDVTFAHGETESQAAGLRLADLENQYVKT